MFRRSTTLSAVRQLARTDDLILMNTTTKRLRIQYNNFYKQLASCRMLDRLPIAYHSFPKDIASEYEKVCLLIDVTHLLNQADSVFLLSEAIFSEPPLSIDSYSKVIDICFPYDSSSSFVLDTRLTLAKLMSCHVKNVSELQLLLQQIHPDDRLEFSLDSKHIFKNLNEALTIFDSLFDAKKYRVGTHFDLTSTAKMSGSMDTSDDLLGRLVFMKAIIHHLHPEQLFMVVSRLAPIQRNEFKELFLKDKQPDERQQILLTLKKLENGVLARSAQFNSNQLFNRDYINQLNKRLDQSAEKAVNESNVCTKKY